MINMLGHRVYYRHYDRDPNRLYCHRYQESGPALEAVLRFTVVHQEQRPMGGGRRRQRLDRRNPAEGSHDAGRCGRRASNARKRRLCGVRQHLGLVASAPACISSLDPYAGYAVATSLEMAFPCHRR
jgi:hypothetical protein